MSTPSTPITASLLVRNHHKKREFKLNGCRYSSTEAMSSEFLSKFVDWRNSRFNALPENQKCDRWYQALLNDGIWQQWFLDGLVESEDILSRSTLAHIYDKLNPTKPNTGSPIGSSARGIHSLAPREHRSHLIELLYFVWIYIFYPLQLHGRRPLPRSARR